MNNEKEEASSQTEIITHKFNICRIVETAVNNFM